MDVRVLEAEDADMNRIFEIASLAFAHNEPFWDTCWPHHDTPTGRQNGAERFTKTKHSDPNTKYLKAFDNSAGKILGMAKWNIYDNHIPDLPKKGGDEVQKYFDSEEDKALMEASVQEFLKTRQDAIVRNNGSVVSLDILAVDPEHQRQGVGDALVKWGLEKADAMGVEAVVESSPFGKGLYVKNGFVFVRDVRLELPEPFADRDVQQFAWLVRPKKT